MLTQNFLLATNTGLTLEFSGYEDLTHFTDNSDNPQDLAVLYLGAVDTTVQLQALSNPGVDNITLTPTDIMPIWVMSTAVTLGQQLQPTTPNGYVYEVTTAGTTGSSEPTWPTSIGSSVTDGTAIFICKRVKHPKTEVTLALTSGALATNTPGAALSLGNTISGGTSNKKTIYMRVINSVTMVEKSVSYPDYAIVINSVIESSI